MQIMFYKLSVRLWMPQGTFQKIPYHPNPYQKQMCNSLVQARNGHWDMLLCGMLYWSGAVTLTRLTAERRPRKGRGAKILVIEANAPPEQKLAYISA
jgi:hypothetical protein